MLRVREAGRFLHIVWKLRGDQPLLQFPLPCGSSQPHRAEESAALGTIRDEHSVCRLIFFIFWGFCFVKDVRECGTVRIVSIQQCGYMDLCHIWSFKGTVTH